MEADRIRTALMELGVDPAKAHEASTRYSSTEAAANWVWGEGENWKPQAEQTPSLNPFHTSGVTGRPPSPASGHKLASNNPFNTYNFPTPPKEPPGIPQDDDEMMLRKALEMSKASGDDGEQRQERERSVRASAPPPSPGAGGRIDDDDNQVVGSLFGPSTKEDAEGKLAVVPASGNNNTSSNTPNKEEEDFQRAIQESMMTASFHSAGDSVEELPAQRERQPDAPLVYVTRSQPSWAANFLQALAATPQFRAAFAELGKSEGDSETFSDLQNLFSLQDTSKDAYALVDREVAAIHLLRCVSSYVPLPPLPAILNDWIDHVRNVLTATVASRASAAETELNLLAHLDETPLLRDVMRSPEQILTTTLRSRPDQTQTHLIIERSYSTPTDIHSNLANIIWAAAEPGEALASLADVVFAALNRTPGVNVQKWQFDEEVVLDRYMHDNLAWSTLIRAQENLLKVDLSRLQGQIEALSTFKGNNLPAAVKVLIKQLSSAETDDDERAELKHQLERISDTIEAKLKTMQDQVKEREATAGDGFKSDDPAKNRHRYRLRSVLWHDGFTTPGKHVFAYVNCDDSWWKVEDTETTRVDFATIQNDMTGQYTDGGPYLLIYSREGPRPDGYSRDDQLISLSPDTAKSMSGSSISEEPMDGVEDGAPTNGQGPQQAESEERQPADADLLMALDDGPSSGAREVQSQKNDDLMS